MHDCNCSEMAALLLGNEKWKEMMENRSNHLPEMPLSHLIVKMPSKCFLFSFEILLCACNGRNDMSVSIQ